MKTLIFLQARLGSTRLPNKVLLLLEGKSVVARMVERLKRVPNATVVLVTGSAARNRRLITEARTIGIEYFCGSEENLLDRFYRASLAFKAKTIVRVTGDSPLIDPGLVSRGLRAFKSGRYDLLLNGRTHAFPHGLDYEIFTADVLHRYWEKRRREFKSERVFQKTFINPTEGIPALPGARVKDITRRLSLGRMRWTLDYGRDYEFIKKIFRGLRNTPGFDWKDILRFVRRNPKLTLINERYIEKGRT